MLPLNALYVTHSLCDYSTTRPGYHFNNSFSGHLHTGPVPFSIVPVQDTVVYCWYAGAVLLQVMAGQVPVIALVPGSSWHTWWSGTALENSRTMCRSNAYLVSSLQTSHHYASRVTGSPSALFDDVYIVKLCQYIYFVFLNPGQITIFVSGMHFSKVSITLCKKS